MEEFDGLSPANMYYLLHGEGEECVFRIVDDAAAHEEVPIVQLVDALLDEIGEGAGLKLTAAGYLPVKTVKALYAMGLLTEEPIESGIKKLAGESSSLVISTARHIAEAADLVREDDGRLRITQEGVAFRDGRDAVAVLLDTFGNKYLLSYTDRFDSELIAQIGYRYSIYLLMTYGTTPHDAAFYAERYFRAFPMLGGDSEYDYSCYSLRTFDRFLAYFGFCTSSRPHNDPIVKRPLMDRYVQPIWDVSLN